MADIYLGLFIVALVSAASFLAALRVSRSTCRGLCDVVAVCVAVAVALENVVVRDKSLLMQWLPVSNLIVVGNWSLLASCLLAGLVWNRVPACRLRKGLIVSSLLFAGGYSTVAPLLGEPPKCDDVWDEVGICHQTTNKTCTAASAATLLRMHGIDATEQEMAELCMTRNGTTWTGLYRGLKLKTAETPWDVDVVTGGIDNLRNVDGPLILSVGLEKNAVVDANYESELGWIPGMGHTVVMLGSAKDGQVEIADPAPDVGRELWSAEQFLVLWRGCAMRLVRRHE